MSANQQDGEEIFFLFLCSFTFHAKNLLWLDCHSRFFYKLQDFSAQRLLCRKVFFVTEKPGNTQEKEEGFHEIWRIPWEERAGCAAGWEKVQKYEKIKILQKSLDAARWAWYS